MGSPFPALPCLCRNSTVTRIMYAWILLLGTIVSCVMLSPGAEKLLIRIPGFCAGGADSSLPGMQADFNCEIFMGYKAVYRVCFGMSMWFVWFSILLVNVKNTKDPRAAVHNGCWFFKVLGLVLVTAGAFYIPDGTFTYAWFAVGSAGAFFFIVIQLVLLVDFAHSWNESWMDRMESEGSMIWYAGLALVTIVNYLLSFIACVLFYVFYTTPDDCFINKFFISFNMLLCIGASVISVLKKVQMNWPYGTKLEAWRSSLLYPFAWITGSVRDSGRRTWTVRPNQPTLPGMDMLVTSALRLLLQPQCGHFPRRGRNPCNWELAGFGLRRGDAGPDMEHATTADCGPSGGTVSSAVGSSLHTTGQDGQSAGYRWTQVNHSFTHHNTVSINLALVFFNPPSSPCTPHFLPGLP
ncbi:serine incorporator 1 isoform X3 [Festucalex cinctus]